MRDRIRVLQVLEATAGGTRRFLRELLSVLPREEFEPIVACSLSRDPSFADDIAEFRRRGIEVKLIPMIRQIHPIRDVRAIVELRRLMRECRCHFIHLHSGKAGLLGRLAALGLGKPVIYSPHAFSFLQDGIIGRVAFVIEGVLARRTHLLLAVSEAERRLALETGFFHAGAVKVLPNAIDAGREERVVTPMEPVRTPEQIRRFALIGELRPQKRPLLLLEAVRKLLRRGTLAHFILPARGALLRPALEFVARHALDHCVSFVPTNQSLNAAYREMDMGVLPSKYEGLPYALLEAFALRRPVLASNIGVFSDVLGAVDQRLLFQSGDADALAEALDLWARLPSEELISAGERGRALMERDYAIDDWKVGMTKIYREVAAMRIARPSSGRVLDPEALEPATHRSNSTIVRELL